MTIPPVKSKVELDRFSKFFLFDPNKGANRMSNHLLFLIAMFGSEIDRLKYCTWCFYKLSNFHQDAPFFQTYLVWGPGT